MFYEIDDLLAELNKLPPNLARKRYFPGFSDEFIQTLVDQRAESILQLGDAKAGGEHLEVL